MKRCDTGMEVESIEGRLHAGINTFWNGLLSKCRKAIYCIADTTLGQWWLISRMAKDEKSAEFETVNSSGFNGSEATMSNP